MKNIKLIFTVIIFIGVLSSALFAQTPRQNTPKSNAPRVGVDRRIELLAIIWRLAGSPSFNQGTLQPYVTEIDKHFAPHRNHAAVSIAR